MQEVSGSIPLTSTSITMKFVVIYVEVVAQKF